METLFTIVWALSFLVVTVVQFTGGRVARWIRKNDKELATRWGLVYDRCVEKVDTRSLIYRDLMTDGGLSFALLIGALSFTYPVVIALDLFRLYVWPHILSSYNKFATGTDKLFDRFIGMLVGILKEEPPVVTKSCVDCKQEGEH